MLRAASKNCSTVWGVTWNRSTNRRVKSGPIEGGGEGEHRVVEAEFLHCTMRPAISAFQ